MESQWNQMSLLLLAGSDSNTLLNVMKMGANKLGLTTTGLWGDENMLVEEGRIHFYE
jgi:hypothetical protein